MALAARVRQKLLRWLDENGWRQVRTNEGSGPWLAWELWCIESVWSPRGVPAWFVVRYQPDNGEPRVLELYLDRPDGIRNPEGSVSFHSFGDADGLEIFDALTRHRDRRPALAGASSSDAASAPETQWSFGSKVLARLRRVAERIGPRKLRLFACACCRRMDHILNEERNRRAIEAAEDYADEIINKRELKKARKAANIPWLTSYDPFREAVQAAEAVLRVTPVSRQEELYRLLDEIVGYPWGPPKAQRAWLKWNEQTVVKMARTIYDEHRFEELPILADALEEAGCGDRLLLGHCRLEGPHVRGCWVVDLLLARS
jgi:hypothetical protein